MPVGLWTPDFGLRVFDVIQRQIELIIMRFGFATELGAAIGQHANYAYALLVHERQHTVVQ